MIFIGAGKTDLPQSLIVRKVNTLIKNTDSRIDFFYFLFAEG